MATIHIESNEEDIAKRILMPGDPLRAKYIAEKFLIDYKLVNKTRNMFGYTGYYKGKKVTVFASGMGMPSMGIYCYELFKYYNVEKIIRIGTSGAGNPSVNIGDVIVASRAYTNSNFANLHCGYENEYVDASTELTNKILSVSNNVKKGNIFTSDLFDLYLDKDKTKFKHPDNIEILANEMEAFALFHIAQDLNRKAACILTCVDSKYTNEKVSSEDREKSLDEMITIALEAI